MAHQSEQKNLLAESAAGIAGVGVLLWGSSLLYDTSETVASWFLIFNIVFYISFVLIYLVYALNRSQLIHDLQRDLNKGDVGDFQLVGVPAMFTLFFVNVAYGAHVVAPGVCFPDADYAIWEWALFGVETILEVLLLDFMEVYGLSFSPVGRPTGFWSKTLVFSFKGVLSVALLSVFLAVRSHLVQRAAPAAPHA